MRLHAGVLPRKVSSEQLLLVVVSLVPLFSRVLGDDDEEYHQGVEGRGHEHAHKHENHDEYEEETFPVHKPRTQATIRADLIRNEIIPEFFLIPPKYEAIITYMNGTKPDFGNRLRPDQVRYSPHTITYKFRPDTLYTLVMTGLDEPSKANPTKREFLFWIVGNIPADHMLAGDHLVEYYPVEPLVNTGEHRYLFLVYEQKKKVKFNEPPLTCRNDWGRANWSSKKFAEKYKLGEPHAVNFFYSEHDKESLVPTTTKTYETSEYFPDPNDTHYVAE